MGINNVISLLSGVALFLFGMTLMGEGLKRVAGNKLELLLYRLAGTPLKGVLLGTGVTAVIQSSSATSVMVVGFVNSGMMKFKNAIGIILGAILGTSITGWIICLSSLENVGGWVSLLSTSTITGIVAVIGIILRMFCKKQEQRHMGDILMGFAVLMFGMSAMSSAVSPLRESEGFLKLMTTFSSPVLGILVGAAFTCVIQSASAAVGILQALASTGAISFSIAFPMIIGIAIGAALPVLLSALGANTNGKRTALIYLLINTLAGIIIGGIFYILKVFIPFGSLMNMSMTMVTVALLNSSYRLITVIIFTPTIGLLEKLSCAIVTDASQIEEKDDTNIDLLEERFLNHPSVALDQSRNVVISMAETAKKSLFKSFDALNDYSEEKLNTIRKLENDVDRYEDKLGTYLVKLNSQELNKEQNKEISKFLHTITDFERISDHANNLGECAKEIYEKNIDFSDEAEKELAVLTSAVKEITENAIEAFTENDISLAVKIEPLEEIIDGLCDEIKLHHIDRIQRGVCTLNQGFVFNDMLTNFERVADHCSNIAVAIIELESEIFDTHEYIDSLTKMKDSDFDIALSEYKAKYSI